MLSSEFNDEMGALVRSLQGKVIQEPKVQYATEREVLDHIERAIVGLVGLHIQIRRRQD